MAYTDAWSSAAPLGSMAAKELDNDLRRLRLQMQERMNEIFVDWTADPIVLKDKLRGIFADKKTLINPASFLLDNGDWSLQPGGVGDPVYAEFEENKRLHCPIDTVPVGATITLVELLVDPVGSFWTNSHFNMYRYGFDAAATSAEVFAVNSALTAKHIISSGVQAIVVDSDSMLEINVSFSVSASAGQTLRVYGARLTYDTPALFP